MDRHRAMTRALNRASSTKVDPAQARPFWRFVDKAAEPTELWIYAEIGFDWWGDGSAVQANTFAAELGKVKGDLTLRVNSPGGDVFDGLAIASLIRDYSASGKGTVTAKVDGLAASIASVIIMAADKVVLDPYAQIMIHDASGGAYGNAAELREVADLLDMISDNIAQVYADRAGGDAKDWRKVMRGEQWYSADEALTAGLADEVLDAKRKRCAACDGKGCPECAQDAMKPCPECDGKGCPECDGTGMVQAMVRRRMTAWLNSYGRKAPISDDVRIPSQASPPPVVDRDTDGRGDTTEPDAATHPENGPGPSAPEPDWPGPQALADAVLKVTAPVSLDLDVFKAALDLVVSSARPDAPPKPVDLGPLPARPAEPARNLFAEMIASATAAAATNQPEPERAPAPPVDLGPLPARQPDPEPTPANPLAELIRGAVALVATDQPEPQATPTPPAELPPLPPIRLDVAATRRAVREARF